MIDNVFDYKNYRYVPIDLRMEWKTLYNLYSGDYFNIQHKLFNIFPQNRIDYYNEELSRLNRVENLAIKFKNNLKNIQPKYNSDIEHSKEIKKSLEKSIDKMLDFIFNKKTILEKKINKNNIPKKKEFIIEKFTDDKKEYDYVPIYITLIMVFLLFYLLF
tara:strand:+ start:466 stop:945 length:480 start_codon:yes stop_codon:yes gene_type:complete